MRIFNFLVLFVAYIFSLALAAGAFAEDNSSEKNKGAVEELIGLLEPIQRLSGEFEQQTLNKKNELIQKQTGSFVIQASGKFIWNILPPFEQKIISNGKDIRVYDPDLEQLTIKTIDENSKMVPLLLFSGDRKSILDGYYVEKRVERVVEKKPDSEIENIFLLTPRSSNSLFSELSIAFIDSMPSQLELKDRLQNVTRVIFSQVNVNPRDKIFFELSVPDNTDIIDER